MSSSLEVSSLSSSTSLSSSLSYCVPSVKRLYSCFKKEDSCFKKSRLAVNVVLVMPWLFRTSNRDLALLFGGFGNEISKIVNMSVKSWPVGCGFEPRPLLVGSNTRFPCLFQAFLLFFFIRASDSAIFSSLVTTLSTRFCRAFSFFIFLVCKILIIYLALLLDKATRASFGHHHPIRLLLPGFFWLLLHLELPRQLSLQLCSTRENPSLRPSPHPH
mmetsp:Transcript_13428/g.32366  ORF Transcript_13428/g.32366 Transcript_13428/m.32366 type:complete len:216 (+) Transcript_13428:1740-2387(+)